MTETTTKDKKISQLMDLEDGRVVLPPLLTIRTTAWYIGLSAKTLRNQLSNGTFKVEPVKNGGKVLFRKKDLDNHFGLN